MELEMNSAGVRSQLTAIAELRWRMFVNGLRSRRGKMELASRIIVTSVFALGGLGGFGLAIGMSWFFRLGWSDLNFSRSRCGRSFSSGSSFR